MNLSSQATEIMMASLSDSTIGQYGSHLSKFREFCAKRKHNDILNITCAMGIEFLTELFNAGLSYSTINSARSAISQFTSLSNSHWQFGSHPATTRFMKGVYKLRPPLPKYDLIWDVAPVLNYVERLDCTSLKNLSMKCAMLLALTTGQRVQTLSALDLNFMTRSTDKLAFAIQQPLKTSKPGKFFSVKILKYTGSRQDICPYLCLSKYLDETKELRDSNYLFVSFVKPHKRVSTQSISRWLTEILENSGVETKFGSHSTRHASTSKAASLNIPVDRIMATVGWESESTFANFYRREITKEPRDFADAVLEG